MNAYLRVVFTILVMLTSSGIVFAQSDLATISGFVKDPSGATVPAPKSASTTRLVWNARPPPMTTATTQ